MLKSVEFIIFDDTSDRDSIEIAAEEARRAGLEVSIFTDASRASDAAGYHTRGVVTSPGIYSNLSQRYVGLSLLEAADIIDIPKAVFNDESAHLVQKFMRDDGSDIYVPRQPYEKTHAALRAWVTQTVVAV